MTVFGGRLLRSWVAHPLRDAAAIQERLDAVEELAEAKSECQLISRARQYAVTEATRHHLTVRDGLLNSGLPFSLQP